MQVTALVLRACQFNKEADLPSLDASSKFSTRPFFRFLNNSLAELILRSGTGKAITRPVEHSKVWRLSLSICPRTFHIFKARSFWLREVSLEMIDLERVWRLRHPSASRNIRTRERSHLGSLTETAFAYLFHRSEHEGRSGRRHPSQECHEPPNHHHLSRLRPHVSCVG